jgi:hypothetical protein
MATGNERGESLECHGSTFFAPVLREPQFGHHGQQERALGAGQHLHLSK